MVEVILIYLLIGFAIWLALDGLGIIQHCYAAQLARGKEPSFAALVLASLLVIVTWPLFVLVWAKGMRA